MTRLVGKAIGINLQKSNSVLATSDGGQADVVVNQEGNWRTPSVVGFVNDVSRLVGPEVVDGELSEAR